jgi:rubrerythrin
VYNGEMTRGCYNPSISTFHKELLNLLIEAMKDERADFIKYKMMIDVTDDEKIREQIRFAYLDEGKHYKMFQQIYYKLSGEVINVPAPKVVISNSFIENIESSINGELAAVELYRKIYSMLPSAMCKNALYEIITDEQEHATRFTYLYAMKR